MNKELETHIQQMADDFALQDGEERTTKHDYKSGFNAADAVGFAEWISGCLYSRMHDGEKYLEWTDGNEIIAKTTEELYLIYLINKTK